MIQNYRSDNKVTHQRTTLYTSSLHTSVIEVLMFHILITTKIRFKIPLLPVEASDQLALKENWFSREKAKIKLQSNQI